MGDEARHYRTDRGSEGSVGYARNERDRPFVKRDGWLGPPGYSRGGHPPGPFTHRRGRFDPSHPGSREYAAQDRLQPVRPSFPGRGAPPPFHYPSGGPRRGHGIYVAPTVERGRPYHLSEPRSSVYSSESYGSVAAGRSGHREGAHDWETREGPSGWDGERDAPPAEWSRNVTLQPSGPVTTVRAPLRAAPRYAVSDVEAGELTSDAGRPGKSSQWDKVGPPMQRAPIQSPTSVQANHVRPTKLLSPFPTSSTLPDNPLFPESAAVLDNDNRTITAEEQARPVDAEQVAAPIADVKLEPRNADTRVSADAKSGDESQDKNRLDAADGEFPSPAPAGGAAGEEHPKTARRRGWGQGLKRLSSATSVKPDVKNEDAAVAVAPLEDAEKSADQTQEASTQPDSNSDPVIAATTSITPALATEPSDGAPKQSPTGEGVSVVLATVGSDTAPSLPTPSSQAMLPPEPVVEAPPFTKAEILMSIEGVDGELGDLEKQLVALNKQVTDLIADEEQLTSKAEELSKPLEFTPTQEDNLDVDVTDTTDESDTENEAAREQEEMQTDPPVQQEEEVDAAAPDVTHSAAEPTQAPAAEVTWRSVVDKVLNENQEAAKHSHGAVGALTCPAEEAEGSCSAQPRASTRDPETVAQLNQLVKQFLLERQKLVSMKQQALANKYLTQEQQYMAQPGVTTGPVRKSQEGGTRSTRNSHHTSDTLRSELDYKLFLQQRQAVSELEDMTKLPDHYLDPWEKRWKSFNNRNNLVQDPERELLEEKLYKENWKKEEKEKFKEAFLLHPKDFGSISEHMSSRTTGECVVFFYKTQKLDEFAAVRRKQQLKKRRLQCESKRHAVPLSYAPVAKSTFETKRGRGRSGGRGRGRGAAPVEAPAPEPEESDTKYPPKLDVSRLDREDSVVTEEANGVVKESPSGVFAEGSRAMMSPNGRRLSIGETPKSSMSPAGHQRDPPVKTSMSPSSQRSPTGGKASSGFWTSLSQRLSVDTSKPNNSAAPLLTPLPQNVAVETPKPAASLLTPLPPPLPPQSDPVKTADPSTTPLSHKSPSQSEPAKVTVSSAPPAPSAPSPSPRMSSEPTTPGSSSGKDQIPGLTYTTYSAWDEREFVKAVHMFGNDPYKISDYLGTKTVGAVKMYFSRNKKRLGLENVQTIRRNPYADDAAEAPPATPLEMEYPLVATLKTASAATAASLLNLAMPPPAASHEPLPAPSTLQIAPLSPLPAAPSTSTPEPPPQPIKAENSQSVERPATTATTATSQAAPSNVSLFQPIAGLGGARGEPGTNISDLLLLQGDNYKHSLPDLSSFFSLNAFHSGAGSPGSAAGHSSNLLTSLTGLPGLGRGVSASAPSLFTNQPYQHSTSEPGPSSQPARQPSTTYAMESFTPRSGEEVAAAIPTTGRGRAANLWSSDEKDRFLDAFKRYGKAWQRLQEAVPSKSMAQIKTYYQNYKIKLGLDKMEVPPVPRFEAGGGSAKRRNVGNRGGAAAVHARDASADGEVHHSIKQSSVLQEAARAWDAKESSLPSWPALNIKEEESHPKAMSPSHPPPSQSPHPSYQQPAPHLTNQPSPFTAHRSTPPPTSQPSLPTHPDSRDVPSNFSYLDPAHIAAAALARGNSGASMDPASIERLDSMLAAYIRSLPEEAGLKLTPQQWQQLMNSSTAAASGQPMGPPASDLSSAVAQQHQQHQQQAQKLPPVPPLLQQLEDVRVLGHNLHLHPSASAAASALPLNIPRGPPAADLAAERRDQQTSALLALLAKGNMPLGALAQHHSILAPPPGPVTSAALPRLPLLDAAAALSSLGLSSMYTAAAAAAGLPPTAGADMLSSLAQQTLLASHTNRPGSHISPLNPSTFSQPPPPAAEYLPPSQLHNLPLHLLSSLNLPHSSAESALLALASASSQQPPPDSTPQYNHAHGGSTGPPPGRAPTPKALDLQGDDGGQTDGPGRSSASQQRKITDLNVGSVDAAHQGYDLAPGSSNSHHPQDQNTDRSNLTAANATNPAELEAAAHMYYPPAKRARYDEMQYDQEGGDNGAGRRDSLRDVAAQQHLAAVTLLSQQSPGLTSAAQMMLQLAAGGLQLRDAAVAANPAAAAAVAAVAAAAGRDGGKSASRQYMEAELARYMQGSFSELDAGSSNPAAHHSASHDFRDVGLPPHPPASMLALEPLRMLSMLSGKKPDGVGQSGLVGPPSHSAASVARQLASLPPDGRSAFLLTNPDRLQQLPFQGLQARSATPSGQHGTASLPRAVPSTAPSGSERLLPDMAGMAGGGLSTMQMREAGTVAAGAELPQWLAGVAGPILPGGAGLAHFGAGLDLNRMAPSGSMLNSSLSGHTGPPAGRGASPFPEPPSGGS